nr:MAG TPA: hypothetical protein [Caudoviricetes sp.]
MRYKVGDRVRYIKYTMYHTPIVKENSIWKIIKVDAKNRMYFTLDETNHKEWFKEEELQKVEYTYKDLEKASIGTKVTFENGEVLVKDDKDIFENSGYVRNILELDNFKSRILGKIIKIEEPEYQTVYESKPEILDEVEKRYLRNVIRPFRDRVKTISKFVYSGGNASIDISIDDNNTGWLIELLPFPKNEMYKGMEDNKKYTIEELGL